MEKNLDFIPTRYTKHGLLCRWIVLEMLGKIFIEKKMISDIEGDIKFSFWHLLPEQKARSLALLETILRNLSLIDNLVTTYLRERTNIRILNIIRIASAELLFNGIRSHAAVDSAVRLTKLEKKLTRFSGLVNAVCRKIALKHHDSSSLGSPSLDKNFVSELRNYYDLDTIKKFSLAQKKRPPLDITIKKLNKQNYYADLLNGMVLSSGTIRLENQNQVSRTPGFEDGDWWVQDFSASIPVRLFGSIEGLSALDVCAAPGGKTMQLAAGGAQVTALEISTKRAKLIQNNLSRTKLSARVIIKDIRNFTTKNLFDIVLVDAPCSATGTIRRNCDLQYLNPHKRVHSLVEQQKFILKRAMSFVKPGGRLIYCTCSLLPAEGEEVIEEALQSSKNWKQTIINAENLGINKKWIDDNGGLRLRPDYWQSIGGMDGFYIAMLSKKN